MTPIQLETRIQELLEGVLSDKYWPELQEILNTSDEARRLYCQHAQIRGLLIQRSKGIKSLNSPAPVIPLNELIQSDRKKSRRFAFVAAAAVILITLFTMRIFFVEKTDPNHQFALTSGSIYVLSHDNENDTPKGLVLKKGSRLQLSQGTVELTLNSGVRSVIQAPADVTLHQDDTLFVNQGIAWFHVPTEAVGFKVKTPDLDIVDLGTEFGVFSRPHDHDEVHVFQGQVKVTAKRIRQESSILKAGESVRVDPIGQLKPVPARDSAFLTSLPDSLPYLHWSFDEPNTNSFSANGSHPEAESMVTRSVSPSSNSGFISVPGKFGNAAQSLGEKTFIDTNWPGIGGDAPRTMTYWIKLSPRQQYLHPTVGWGQRPDFGTRSFHSFINTTSTGTVVAGISFGGLWFTGKTPIADGQWHHIAHVYTGRSDSNGYPEIYNYIDGKAEETTVSSYHNALKKDKKGNIIIDTETSARAAPLRIFHHLIKGSEPYTITPSIDELFIFQATLGPQQIESLYLNNKIAP